MNYVERHFTDEIVYLDGHTFTRCVFEGCILRYAGGSCSFDGFTYFKITNKVEFATGIDEHTNDTTRLLVAGVRRQGGAPGSDIRREPGPALRKDLG